MNLLNKAIKDRNVLFDKKKNIITYLPHQKVRNLKNPEEEIQLETFLELIYTYQYPAHKLKVSDKLKMGSSTKEADIMVYKDDDCKDPFIVVECKKRAVSANQFEEAIDQGFSYAAATGANFVWVTSGRYNAHFEVMSDKILEREENRLPSIPKHKEESKSSFKMRRKVFRLFGGIKLRKIWDNPILTDTMLYMATLAIFMVIFSKLAVEYFPEISKVLKPYWDKGMDFSDIFIAIVGLATVTSLGFGMLFMRSHKLLGTPQLKRQLDFLVISLILLAPAWYMSVSNSDPLWWTWKHYNGIKFQTKIYLWPFLKAFPFQALAVYVMIWLMTKTKKR